MITHYLSSAVLRRDASSMALIQLLSPTDRGQALNTQHQLVWSLFANDASASDKRRFIWRNPLMHTNKVLRLRADAGFFPQFTGGGFH